MNIREKEKINMFLKEEGRKKKKKKQKLTPSI